MRERGGKRVRERERERERERKGICLSDYVHYGIIR